SHPVYLFLREFSLQDFRGGSHTAKENRLSQSKFRCQVCGYTANADVNGARNILAAGHAVLACGEMVQSGRPLKQEPTEMIQATA
ncbi:transposase, partial [Escherichia coli]